MNRSYEELEGTAKRLIDQGMSDQELVSRLHDLGASILDSMKIIRSVRRISLGVAKEIVTGHPVWQQDVSAAEALHDEAEEAVKQAGGESDSGSYPE